MNGDGWLILDVFRNVTGPYTREEVRRRGQRQPNFFVYLEDGHKWAPVDSVPELASDPGGQSGAIRPGEYQAGELEGAINELLGVCKGIIADDRVDPDEVAYLKSWLEQHQKLAGCWPANVLSERIAKIYEDGVVDKGEREELAELLYRITGEKPGLKDAMKLAASVVLDVPEPDVDFKGKAFCLSGRLAFGARAKCREAIERRGGVWHEHPNLETDYLVIGALDGNQVDLTHGRNIEFVVKNPAARSRIAIISEENWAANL